ncbi:MAG: SpoIVB peptidase [Bacillota bacterium]|nr:SpoIVB peptidase [Bacillota bacterium]
MFLLKKRFANSAASHGSFSARGFPCSGAVNTPEAKRVDSLGRPRSSGKAGLRRFSLLFLLLTTLQLCIPVAALAEESLPVEEAGLLREALPRPQRERRYAIPGGQSIGVLLSTDGVTVVGFSPAVSSDGSFCNPAEDADLVAGDFITSVNGEQVLCNGDLSRIVSKAGAEGKNCSIVYLRNGTQRKTILKPVFCQDTKSWRIGLYVRDNVCGVGTLSFYDAKEKKFAALGHEVEDIQHDAAGESIGSVIRASVQSIRAADSGNPGEKMGSFLQEEWQGEIFLNGRFGVYGVMNTMPEYSRSEAALPIAFPDEVESGPAEIYTVLEGEKIESFNVNIIKTLESHKSSGHGMILEITDERLIEKCGGIVQGMSGSPIIQNGFLVGSVTHVFIDDPLHGYGCFASWMLEEAENGPS